MPPTSLLELIADQLHQEPSALWLNCASYLPKRISRLQLSAEEKAHYVFTISRCCASFLQMLADVNGACMQSSTLVAWTQSLGTALEANPDIVQSLMSFGFEVSRYQSTWY